MASCPVPAIALRSFLLLITGAVISSAMTPEIAGMIITSQNLFDAGQYERSADLLQQARSKALEQNDTYTEALILNRLGLVRERAGKLLEARQAFDAGLSRMTSLRGPDTPELLVMRNNLANLLCDSNQYPQAEALVRRNLDILAVAGPRDSRTGAELAILSKMQLGAGKVDPAERSAEESLSILKETGKPDDLTAAIAYSVIGAISGQRNARARAEEALESALAILQKNRLDPRDNRVTEAIANLGLLYEAEGSSEKAAPLLEEAHASFRAASLNNAFVRQFLERWASLEKKAGRKRKAKQLSQEAKALADSSSEAKMSRYTVDANAFR